MNKPLNKMAVQATINGEPTAFLCSPGQVLAEVLRDELELIGTKIGCNTGDCGACSVLVNDRLVCACLVLAAEVEGQAVQTIEGVAEGGVLHPVQQKLLEHAGLQCGICTPRRLRIGARSRTRSDISWSWRGGHELFCPRFGSARLCRHRRKGRPGAVHGLHGGPGGGAAGAVSDLCLQC